MKKKIIAILLIANIALHNNILAQTPATPMINWATQFFLDRVDHSYYPVYNLVISQFISPRVFKPSHPASAEIIRIMFMGNWLDITDEVKVTAPNSSVGMGVNFSRIIEKKNSYTVFPPGTLPLHGGYSGPYIIVEFFIASDAVAGTHTVRLRRPRLGAGKDEAVFYIEVYDAVRIHKIRFSRNLFQSGALNATGLITITGNNLNRISSIGNCNGMLASISNFTKTDNVITFNARLAKKGNLDYNALMSSVLPARLKNNEYPSQNFDGAGFNTDKTPLYLTIN